MRAIVRCYHRQRLLPQRLSCLMYHHACYRWLLPFSQLGFPVMGIWEKGQAARSVCAVDRSPDHRFVATGNEDGQVSLPECPQHK